MKESFISSTYPVENRLTWRKALLFMALTAGAIALGIFLTPNFGPVGSYAPLVAAVVVNSWLGGLWPGVLTQVAGGGSVFAVLAHPFSSTISTFHVWALLGFLVVAKLATGISLTLRHSRHLQRTSEQLELISQATHDSIWDWDVRSGKVWRSGKIDEIFGCSKEELVPEISWWRGHLDPQQESRVWGSLQRALQGDSERWAQEYQLVRDDGSSITISDHARILRDKKGKAVRMVGGMADISAERRAEERLEHVARHDSLTGLPNRELFLAHLENLPSNSARRAVLFLDVDRFKQVNDTFGHQIGDRLLISVSTRLVHYLRDGDLAGRFGGDKFIVLLDGVDCPTEAMQVAERILLGLAVPFHLGSQELSVTASIGVACNGSGPAETLLQHADLAMYQAKQQGRGQCKLFDPALEDFARMQLRMEAELRRSFRDGSLRLYYQPIVALQDGALASFEALLRWQHPARGLVLPSEILPVAESGGLSIQLGKWVLREACNRLRAWQDLYPGLNLAMNANISGADFIRPELIDEVRQLLHDTGVSGESLIIELTETTIMESNVDAARRLRQLRDMGIRLAIDDFGKGHSSLGRLQDFPISILKIDSSFVHQIGEGKRQILDAIIALAHELNLEITAEGVETREQLIYLKEKGAAKVQGLLFAPALAEEAAGALLVNRPWNLPEYLGPAPGLSTGIGAG